MTMYRVVSKYVFEYGSSSSDFSLEERLEKWFEDDELAVAEVYADQCSASFLSPLVYVVVEYEVDIDNARKFAEIMIAEAMLPRKKRNPIRLMKLGEYGEGADVVFETEGVWDYD